MRGRITRAQRFSDERGVIFAFVVITLMALLASAALAVDVGRIAAAANRAQIIADAAALAGSNHFPGRDEAVFAAQNVIYEYDPQVIGDLSTQIQVCAPGEVIPDGRTLGPYAWAIRVTATIRTPLVFAALFGLRHASPTRQAMAIYGPVSAAPIAPIWIPDDEYVYGQPIEFFYSPLNDPEDWIPGNFGWLRPPSNEVSFIEMLRGDNLTPEQLQAATVHLGDVLHGLTGVTQGQTRSALQSRIDRASQPPYDQDTFGDFHSDNPRIMIVPLVTYLGGCGANASFRVERFAATWLESLNFHGANSRMTVRFIEYRMDATPDISARGHGVSAVQLVE